MFFRFCSSCYFKRKRHLESRNILVIINLKKGPGKLGVWDYIWRRDARFRLHLHLFLASWLSKSTRVWTRPLSKGGRQTLSLAGQGAAQAAGFTSRKTPRKQEDETTALWAAKDWGWRAWGAARTVYLGRGSEPRSPSLQGNFAVGRLARPTGE